MLVYCLQPDVLLQKRTNAAVRINREWLGINDENPPRSSMNNPNRDLLVLFNNEIMTQKAIEHEVEQLHQLLYAIEGIDSLVVSHEIYDLNKHNIIKKQVQLRKLIRHRELKPFVFLNCNN